MPPKKHPLRRAKRTPKGTRIDVSRAEFDRVLDILKERGPILTGLRKDLDIQFKRIAQMQAELDVVRQMLAESPLRKIR
jgi:hypothetical protein